MKNKNIILYLVIFLMILQSVLGIFAFADEVEKFNIKEGETNINIEGVYNDETSFQPEGEDLLKKYEDEFDQEGLRSLAHEARDISSIINTLVFDPDKGAYKDGDRIGVKAMYDAASTNDIRAGDYIRIYANSHGDKNVSIYNKGSQSIYLTDLDNRELEVARINVLTGNPDYIELVFNENIEKINKAQVVGSLDFTMMVRNDSTEEDKSFSVDAGGVSKTATISRQENTSGGVSDTIYYKTGDMQPDRADELRWFLSFMPSNVKKAVYGPVVIVDELENKDAHEIIEDSIQLTINVAGNYKTYKKEDINPNNNDLYSTGIDLRQVSLYSTKDRIELSIPDYVAGDSRIESLQVYYRTKILKDVEEFGNSSYLRFSNSPDIENNKIVSNGRVRNINFGGTISAVPRQLIIEKFLDEDDYPEDFKNKRIPGVEFEILKDGRPLDLAREDLTTNKRGLVTINNLEPGNYEVRERAVLDGMILNPEPQKFTIGENDSQGVVLQFRNKIKRKDIKIKKVWVNEKQEPIKGLDDNPSVKPISVALKAKSSNGERLIGEYDLNKDNNWSYELKNVLAYYIEDLEAGILSEYEFVIEELNGEDYLVEVTREDSPGVLEFLVTNTIKDEEPTFKTREISLVKKWLGSIGEGIEEISLSLKEKGKIIRENIIIKAKDQWKKVIEIAEDIDLADLELEEDKLEGYLSIVEKNEAGFLIKNIETLDLSVKKEWSKDASQFKEPIRVRLLARVNGEDLATEDLGLGLVETSVVLNEDNNWEASFKELPKYTREMEEIHYSVGEEFLTSGLAEKLYPVITGDMASGYLITNNLREVEPEKRDIRVSKKWIGLSQDELSKASIRVELYADGEFLLDGTIKGNGSIDFKDLDKYRLVDGKKELINYEVKEPGLVDNFKSEIEGNMDEGFRITNTLKNINIKIEKYWELINKEDIPTSLVFKLTRNGQVFDYDNLGIRDSSERIYLRKDPSCLNMEKTIYGLDLYDGLGNKYDYDLVEYGDEYNVKIEKIFDGDSYIFKVTNSPKEKEKTRLEIEKKWEIKDKKLMDEIGEDLIEIEVQLLKDGENYGEPIRLRGRIGDKSAWKYTFDGLDRFDTNGDEINYSVVETKMPSWVFATEYDYSTKGKVLINNISEEEPRDFIRPKMDLDVKKEWILKSELGREKYKNEVKDIEVELLVDGEASGKTLVLNEDNNWKASFKDLDKFIFDFKDGRPNIIGELDYSIRENTSFSWIEVEILGGPSEGFTLVNKEREDLPPEKPEEPSKPEEPEEPSKPEKPEEPSKPEKPEEPNKPEKPEEPSKPEKPEEPSKPEKPEEPNKPEKPEEPSKPEKPEEPSKPEKPEEPSKPEKPEEPSKPEKPEEPSKPEKPEEPSKPEKPEEPSKPEEPEEPSKPEKPEEPSKPEKPEEPNKPEKPEEPSKPEKPEEPSKPEKPEEPNKPEKPEKPSRPEKPEEPNKPEKPSKPEKPEEPSKPEEPEKPSRPEEPEEPNKPEEPEEIVANDPEETIDQDFKGIVVERDPVEEIVEEKPEELPKTGVANTSLYSLIGIIILGLGAAFIKEK